MALYRQTATGFVCEFASNPGSGFTLISSQPTDTIANRVNWWRAVDKGSLTSTWHPSEIAGPEVPGRDTNAGKGVNILPNDYASFEWAGAMPPNYTSGMTVNRTAAATYHGQYGIRLTTTSAGGTVWLAASGSVFNIALAPSSKWIVSAYVRPLTNAAVSGTLRLKTQGGITHSVSFTSGASSSGWVRVSGVFDLSADTSEFGQLGISITNNSTSLDIDALMLEEKIGPYDTASVWYSPWGNGLSDDEIGDGSLTQDKLFGDLSDRIDLIDASSLVPGSVNARLASQYDTLVQQISEVSVGNGQFDSKIIWYFDQSSEITGWTGTSASLAVSGGYLTVTGTGSNPKFKTATIAVDGSAYQLVRLRVKRTGGSGWTGTLRYYYSGGSNTITISEPAQIGSEYVEASWDMAGVALWTANTITAVEIQLGTASGDNYSIDWMGVGRNAPGASYSQVEAVRVLSDNKTRVFYEASNPTNPFNGYSLKTNDLLFRTDQGNKPYRWNGSAWAETTDTRLADSWAEILDIRNATANPSGAAAQRINSISTTASSKNRTFYQASTSAPSSPTTGDLWFQTDQGNKAFRWSGSAWVETTDGRLPTAVASITDIQDARIGYCTIGSNTSVHGTKSACEAAGGTWNVGLPWATAVKQVSITAANGQSATVQQQFETIYGAGGLRAQYSVKLDVNGYVAGFGLYNEGAGASGFIVRADKFVVGSAGSNVVPFEIVSGTTYIKDAVIRDGTITSAKIGSLNADKITGGFLDMARINTGAITAEKIDSRGLSIKDASGNVIFSSGVPLDSARVNPSSGWLNSNISINSNGTLSGGGGGSVTITGLGYTGALDATKNQIWQQATAPTTGVTNGDIWINTSDANKLYLRSDGAWVLRRDTGIDAALSAAASAQDTADGKIDTYYQTTAPTAGMSLGDLWFDTDDGNKLYRYSGTAWVIAQDQSIGTAINNAATAQSTADGKITTYFGTIAPAGTKAVGDLWYNDNTKLLQRWTGSAWVTVSNSYTNTNQLTDGAGLGTTATWSGVSNIPYETIYNNDDSVAMGFNPTFSAWTGAYPAGWSANSGAAPTKETTLVRVGEFAVRYNSDGTDRYMARTYTFGATPLPVGTFLSGTIDVYLESRTSGLPGILIDLFTNSGYTSYARIPVQPPGTATGTWQRVPWTARVGQTQQIYGIRIYVMGSWTGFASGAFTGNVIFDNLRFALFDATTDNQQIKLQDNSGTVSIINGGGGSFTGITTNNPISLSNISTFISGAAIGTAYIADAAITNAKILNGAITTAKIGDAQITGAKIGSATITNANIANATITDAKISGTLSADRIAAGSITTAKLNFTPVQAGGAAADINAFTTTINGSKITTNSITTSQLNFSVVQPSNVVASINATTEGLRIAGNRITIDGNVTFASGYNPTSKIASGGAATDINNNTTTINGAKITTGTITAEKIQAGAITADKLSADQVWSKQITLADGYPQGYIKSSNFTYGGNQGFLIGGDGNAEFYNVKVRGDILLGGGNLIQNSEGRHGVANTPDTWREGVVWGKSNAGMSVTMHSTAFATAFDSWKPFGGEVFVIEEGAYNASYASQFIYCVFTTPTAWQTFPVIADQWYQFSVYSGAHRCRADVRIDWYTSSGGYISTTVGTANNAEQAGGTSLASFKLITVTGKAPAGATRAYPVVLKNHTFSGQSSSYVFFTRATFCGVPANQTSTIPWSPGGISLIDTLAMRANAVTAFGTVAEGERASGTNWSVSYSIPMIAGSKITVMVTAHVNGIDQNNAANGVLYLTTPSTSTYKIVNNANFRTTTVALAATEALSIDTTISVTVNWQNFMTTTTSHTISMYVTYLIGKR